MAMQVSTGTVAYSGKGWEIIDPKVGDVVDIDGREYRVTACSKAGLVMIRVGNQPQEDE